MTKDADSQTPDVAQHLPLVANGNTGSAPMIERSEAEKSEGVPNFQSAFRQAFTGDEPLPPIAPGFVRPLTDPEAVERWRAERETPEAVFEYNPIARSRLP